MTAVMSGSRPDVVHDATAGDAVATGTVHHEKARDYQFVVYRDGAGHTLCSDDYFLPGDRFPNQQVVMPDPTTGGTRTVETPHGIYPVLRAYSYYNPDVLGTPDDWRCVAHR